MSKFWIRSKVPRYWILFSREFVKHDALLNLHDDRVASIELEPAYVTSWNLSLARVHIASEH